MSDTIETLVTTLKATLSIPPILPTFLGKSAANKVYPGKKNTKESPRAMRRTPNGKIKKVAISRAAKMFISKNSSLSFIRNILILMQIISLQQVVLFPARSVGKVFLSIKRNTKKKPTISQ